MKQKLKEYMDVLFADAEKKAPGEPRLAELKEEMLRDLYDKYDDLVASGRSPEKAYCLAVSGMGDMDALLDSVVGGTGDAASDERKMPAPSEEPPAKAPESSATEAKEAEEIRGAAERADVRPCRSRWYRLVSGIIWTSVMIAYLAVSFATRAWGTTWLIFIMGIAANNVAAGIFDLRR